MRPMQLHPPKPRIRHESCSINKTPNRPFNIRFRHLPRLRPRHSSNNPLKQTIPNMNRDCTGRNRRGEDTPFSRDAERLSAWVADLGYGGCAMFLAGGGIGGPFFKESGILGGVGVFGV